jgi:hypothetical protein
MHLLVLVYFLFRSLQRILLLGFILLLLLLLLLLWLQRWWLFAASRSLFRSYPSFLLALVVPRRNAHECCDGATGQEFLFDDNLKEKNRGKEEQNQEL